MYRSDGLAATFRLIAEALGIDPTGSDAEPGLTPQPMTPQRLRNFEFFIEHDLTAIVRDTLDVVTISDSSTRIVPAVGLTTPRKVFDHECAVALADLLDAELRVFPGGHNGNTSHPRAYAAALHAELRSARNHSGHA